MHVMRDELTDNNGHGKSRRVQRIPEQVPNNSGIKPEFPQKPAKRLPHLCHHQHHSKRPREREPENPDFDIFGLLSTTSPLRRVSNVSLTRTRVSL